MHACIHRRKEGVERGIEGGGGLSGFRVVLLFLERNLIMSPNDLGI